MTQQEREKDQPCYCTRIHKEHKTRDCGDMPRKGGNEREWTSEHDSIMREVLGHG